MGRNQKPFINKLQSLDFSNEESQRWFHSYGQKKDWCRAILPLEDDTTESPKSYYQKFIKAWGDKCDKTGATCEDEKNLKLLRANLKSRSNSEGNATFSLPPESMIKLKILCECPKVKQSNIINILILFLYEFTESSTEMQDLIINSDLETKDINKNISHLLSNQSDELIKLKNKNAKLKKQLKLISHKLKNHVETNN